MFLSTWDFELLSILTHFLPKTPQALLTLLPPFSFLTFWTTEWHCLDYLIAMQLFSLSLWGNGSDWSSHQISLMLIFVHDMRTQANVLFCFPELRNWCQEKKKKKSLLFPIIFFFISVSEINGFTWVGGCISWLCILPFWYVAYLHWVSYYFD